MAAPVASAKYSATAGSRKCPFRMACVSFTGGSSPIRCRHSRSGVLKGLAPMIVPASDDPMPLSLSRSHSSWLAGRMIVYPISPSS